MWQIKRIGSYASRVLEHRVNLGSYPRVPRSAGFSSPGQWLQSAFFVRLSISFTRYCTNCFHSPRFIIRYKAVMLSSHNLDLLILTCERSAFSTVVTSGTKIRADMSSNLGIDSSFSGATRVFEVTIAA